MYLLLSNTISDVSIAWKGQVPVHNAVLGM